MTVKLGKKGENIAKEYLISRGYQIIEQNWRDQHKEIDIIAETDDLIVFVEVKTRSDDYYGRPAEAVGKKKQDLLIMAAESYLYINQIEKESRFDIIEIIVKNGKVFIEHIPDAFSGFSL